MHGIEDILLFYKIIRGLFGTSDKLKGYMDVLFALKNIEIRNGFKGYTRNSSTFCHQTDAVGLSAFIDNLGARWLLSIN